VEFSSRQVEDNMSHLKKLIEQGDNVTILNHPHKSRRFISHLIVLAALVSLGGCGSTGSKKPDSPIPSSVPDVPAGAERSTAVSSFESGNFGFSANYFQQALAKSPKDMSACLGMAASYDWLYRFDLADRAYAKCAKIDKNSFHYHNNIGFSYILRGEHGKASASLARANQIRPNDPLVETNLRILRDATSG